MKNSEYFSICYFGIAAILTSILSTGAVNGKSFWFFFTLIIAFGALGFIVLNKKDKPLKNKKLQDRTIGIYSIKFGIGALAISLALIALPLALDLIVITLWKDIAQGVVTAFLLIASLFLLIISYKIEVQ